MSAADKAGVLDHLGGGCQSATRPCARSLHTGPGRSRRGPTRTPYGSLPPTQNVIQIGVAGYRRSAFRRFLGRQITSWLPQIRGSSAGATRLVHLGGSAGQHRGRAVGTTPGGASCTVPEDSNRARRAGGRSPRLFVVRIDGSPTGKAAIVVAPGPNRFARRTGGRSERSRRGGVSVRP